MGSVSGCVMVSDQLDPETLAMTRESISPAYLTVIQLLPPRQRSPNSLRPRLHQG